MKKPLKKIRLRSIPSGGELEIRVVGETETEWHGRYWVGTRWWPPPPNYYVYRKKTQWVKA